MAYFNCFSCCKIIARFIVIPEGANNSFAAHQLCGILFFHPALFKICLLIIRFKLLPPIFQQCLIPNNALSIQDENEIISQASILLIIIYRQ